MNNIKDPSFKEVTNQAPETQGKLIETPWQQLIPESAILRAVDNLMATYGENKVIDLIVAAYIVGITPGNDYEK